MQLRLTVAHPASLNIIVSDLYARQRHFFGPLGSFAVIDGSSNRKGCNSPSLAARCTNPSLAGGVLFNASSVLARRFCTSYANRVDCCDGRFHFAANEGLWVGSILSVTLVFFASGVQTVKGLGTWFDRSWLAGTTNLVGTSALWIALALLFFPEARGWFRRAQLARRGR